MIKKENDSEFREDSFSVFAEYASVLEFFAMKTVGNTTKESRYGSHATQVPDAGG